MATLSTSTLALAAFFVLLLRRGSGSCTPPPPSKGGGGGNGGSSGDGSGGGGSKQFRDVDYLGLALNLEYLETDFFLCAATGKDLSSVNPELANGGPKPQGCTKATFHYDWIQSIILQFAYQEIGHLRAIQKMTTPARATFPRPLLDITRKAFATLIDTALSTRLNPPFDVYADDFSLLVGAYIIPYVGLTAYRGSAGSLDDPAYKSLVAGLLAVESGQDAVIRAILFQYKDYKIDSTGITIENVTNAISELRNKLGGQGRKDEGLVVDPSEGAEGKIAGNVLAGDENSVAYARSPREVLNIVYSKPNGNFGGFYPKGADGVIANSLKK